MIVKCPTPGCDFVADNESDQVIVALLNIHLQTAHMQAPPRPSAPPPRLDRPKIDVGVEEEAWNGFIRRWNAFKVGSGIGDDTAPMQFFQCATDHLGDLVLKAYPNVHNQTLEDIQEHMKELAVIPIAIGVRRAELMELRQAPDEPFRTFAANVQGKAETCAFLTTVECVCNRTIQAEYKDETVKDVLLSGIADTDIRREALSTTQKKSVNDIIAFVESREMARNATPSSNVLSALSSYKKIPATVQPPTGNGTKNASCIDCGKQFQPFKQRPDGSWNSKPFVKCRDCWKHMMAKRKKDSGSSSVGAFTTTDTISQVSTLETIQPQKIISKNELKRSTRSDHPRVHIKIAKPNDTRHADIMAVADSGAMSNLWGLKEFLDAGFTRDDIVPVTIDIRAANKVNLNVVGYFRANICGDNRNGKNISCYDKIFISDSVQDFYLSFDTMLSLGILSSAFPEVGQFRQEQEITTHATISTDTSAVCDCPKRGPVPPRPAKLPFEPTEENNGKMRDWLLDYFKSSTFNVCPHTPLPAMSGPPIEMHVDESAKPRACHTAAPIALHWQEQVHKDLLRDEALGVIERVPYGEPVTWCHRMVVTRKHDGTPRRTVDLSPLNKFCKRETFSAEAPFPLARRVPGKSWKTVIDAWNGYHSIPLREEDRHLTTFITPFGRWRYTRAPQGFLSSGDGYNRRFDAILSDFERKERCVDDVLCHDDHEKLEAHWWRVIDLLITCGKSGIVLNSKPGKFQFCQKKVNFAGFRLTEDKILPLPKYIDAIKAFPTPTSTTDIRSWFGLINRVGNYAKLRDAMSLFKPFLSHKYQFFWSEVLEKAFQESKNHIIESIREGVEIFDINKLTCLRPDWSKKGIGYFLLQKHCRCDAELPDCCNNGWKITLAGSRFLRGPEQRYAAIEGEALAIVWGLEQTKYFTQGCPNLIVVTDHKPLVKIFSDRTLDEISNTRLFRLKQRSLLWYFQVHHKAGVTNSAADAVSRYPTEPNENAEDDENEEQLLVAGICRDITNVSTITWDVLVRETEKDPPLDLVLNYLSGKADISEVNKEYRKYADSMYMNEGVILYKDRVVIPTALRQTALENLHAAHQGVSSMEARASTILFWPGMSDDINRTRAKCTECNINAPSQASLPSVPANTPSTPFEKIFADYFDYAGCHYLAITLLSGTDYRDGQRYILRPTAATCPGQKALSLAFVNFLPHLGSLMSCHRIEDQSSVRMRQNYF